MQLFRRRPLAVACFVFLLSSVLAACLTGPARLFACGTVILFALIFLWIGRGKPFLRRPARFAAILSAVLLFTLLRGYFTYELPARVYTDDYGTDVTVTARVTGVRSHSLYSGFYTADLREWDGRPASGGIAFSTPGDCLLAVGDTVTFTGSFSAVSDGTDGDNPLSLLSDGVFSVCREITTPTVTDEKHTVWEEWRTCSDGAREALGRYLVAAGGEGGKLAGALLLGERSLLPARVTRDFRRAGLSHLLALSGLHLSVLFGLLEFLLSRLPIGRRARNALALLLIWGYVFFVGFPLSVVRAAAMLTVLLLALFVARKTDGLTSLFFAAAAIMLIDPCAVYDIGFFLSVSATFGILVYGEARAIRRRLDTRPARLPWERRPGKVTVFFRRSGRRMLDALCVSLAAIAATLPISAFFFGEISPIAPFSNLLFGPLFAAYLLLSVLLLALGWIAPIGWLIGQAGAGLCALVSYPAALPFSLFSLSEPWILAALVAGAILLFCLLVGRTRARVFFTAAGTVCGVFVLSLLLVSVLRGTRDIAVFRSEGRNDTLLFRVDGAAVVCDASDGVYAGVRRTGDMLSRAGVCEIDTYVVTHYHAHTVTSFARLSGQILIRRVCLPDAQNETERGYRERLIAAAEENGVAILPYAPATRVTAGPIAFSLAYDRTGDSHPVLALTVLNGTRRFTYLGTACVDNARVGDAVLRVAEETDILYFGTHGPAENQPHYPATYSRDLSAVFFSAARPPLPNDLRAALSGHGATLTQVGAEPLMIPFPRGEE